MTFPSELKFVSAAISLALAGCSAPAIPSQEAPPQTQGPIMADTGATCGGIAAIQCGSPADYCAMPATTCGQVADAAGICKPKPEMCTMQYKPVCGCDGKTYSNSCAAASKGASIAHDGAC